MKRKENLKSMEAVTGVAIADSGGAAASSGSGGRGRVRANC